MRKIFNTMVAVALAVAMGLAFTACGDDDDDDDSANQAYFTLGVSGLHVSGPTEGEGLVMNYMNEVFAAYSKALGMTSDNTLIVKGNFNDVKGQMAAKFDKAELPETLVWEEGSYTFTITLSGYSLGSDGKLVDVASQTFTNEAD